MEEGDSGQSGITYQSADDSWVEQMRSVRRRIEYIDERLTRVEHTLERIESFLHRHAGAA